MSRQRHILFFKVSSQGRRYWFATLLLALTTARARAQTADFWQAQAAAERSPWIPQLKYIKTDVEGEKDSFRSSSGGGTQELDRLYVAPSFGVGWDYYLYHPYLLTYSMLLEPGYIIRSEGPPNALRRTDELMLNGKFTANILQLKPYASTITYTRNYGEIKYDIFNSALVDSQSYGFGTGYREGAVPVTLDFTRSHEDSTGFNQTATTDQTMIDLRARNERAAASQSDFTYQYGQFDRDLDAGGSHYVSENDYHHISANDTEHFETSSLKSSLLFYDITSGTSTSYNLNTALNYNWDITPHLQNFDNYALTYFAGDGGDSVQNYASAGLTHRLYESLISSIQVNGSTLNSSSPGTTLDSQMYGITGSVDYTKRLGDWGRLTIGDSVSYTFNNEQSSGQRLLIPNESYTVPTNGLVRLNQPREIAVISVTDANNIPYVEGVDFNLIETTDPWQIQIPAIGSHIKPGSVILVTYTVRPNPSGSYTTVGNSAQINLRLWKDRINLFARYNYSDSQASSTAFYLDNLKEFQAGAELDIDGLVLHGDYTDHHSTFYSFHGYNLVEGYSMDIASDSTLGVDLTQQWLTFSNTGGSSNQMQNMTFYSFALHHEWHPTTHLSFNTEAGYRIQRGFGLDQNVLAVRAYMNWKIGKSELHCGYEHENESLMGERSLRDFAFLRVRRNF